MPVTVTRQRVSHRAVALGPRWRRGDALLAYLHVALGDGGEGDSIVDVHFNSVMSTFIGRLVGRNYSLLL